MLGIMKAVLALVCLFFAVASVQGADDCYYDVVKACQGKDLRQSNIASCTAKYGAIGHLQPDLSRYAVNHITRSFEYLLFGTHYGNYEKNRAGFEKLFRGLSDEKWHEGIELIKYVTKRGGEMEWPKDIKLEQSLFEFYELQALAKALDIEKDLAEKALAIHGNAARRKAEAHDPEIADHIEHEFVHKQRDNVRKLSGYVSDLSKILDGPDASVGTYLFDEYLQKQ